MLIPLGNGVLVKEIKVGEKKINNIYLPSTSEDKIKRGKVISFGCEVKDLKVNDVVMYEIYTGKEIDYEGEKYSLINFEDLLLKLEWGW